jgi:hypothetical protein
MTKMRFLEAPYFEMLASGTFVCERWQESFDNFLEDLEHTTPSNPGRRFLGLRKEELGFLPGNVEWHFRSTEKPRAKRDKGAQTELESAKEKRRMMIAEQYRQWEEKISDRDK